MKSSLYLDVFNNSWDLGTFTQKKVFNKNVKTREEMYNYWISSAKEFILDSLNYDTTDGLLGSDGYISLEDLSYIEYDGNIYDYKGRYVGTKDFVVNLSKREKQQRLDLYQKEQDVELKNNEIIDLKDKLDLVDKDIQLKDQKIEDLKKEIEELKKQRETNEEIDRLQNKVDDLQNKIDDLEQKLNSYDSDKDVEIRELRKKKEELETEKKELEDNLDKCQKQKDIGYDPDDPFNPCKPYKGGKSRMKVSKAGQRPRDLLDGLGMQAQCCAENSKQTQLLAQGLNNIAKSIKSNQFIGVTQRPITIKEVEISKVPQEIPNYQVSQTVKEIPNIQVSGEPIVIQNIQKEVEPTVIPNIQKESTITKIPNFEQTNLDFNKFVEAIDRLDSTVKNDLTKSIKDDLTSAVKEILFSNSTTHKTAKNNLIKVLDTLTKKGTYNPSTDSSGIVKGSYTPLEFKAMRDKAELQKSNDENNFDIDINEAIAIALADLFKKEPEYMDMLEVVNKLTRKS